MEFTESGVLGGDSLDLPTGRSGKDVPNPGENRTRRNRIPVHGIEVKWPNSCSRIDQRDQVKYYHQDDAAGDEDSAPAPKEPCIHADLRDLTRCCSYRIKNGGELSIANRAGTINLAHPQVRSFTTSSA